MKWWGVSTGLSLLAVVILTAIPVPTNCGGNSEALAAVQEYVLCATLDAEGNPTAISEGYLTQARQHLERHPRGGFLISTEPLSREDIDSPRLLVVCDKSYRNVPRYIPWFDIAPATHAAGYSDGSTRLISPAEFAALDRSRLQYLVAEAATGATPAAPAIPAG